MSAIVTIDKLDINNVIITDLKLNQKKQLTAGIINGKTNSALFIETPYLINPFGVSAYDSGGLKEEQKSYSLSLKATGGSNESPENVKTFFDFFKKLDDKVVQYGITNSEKIFKKKYDETLVRAFYNTGIKPSPLGPDGTPYPDKISVKIMKKEDFSPDLLVFKDGQHPLEINSWEELQNNILKGTAVKCIIQPKFYIVNGKFGVNFRVLQIKIPSIQKMSRPITYAFSDESTTENIPLKELSLSKQKVESNLKENNAVADSDEEDEDEDDEEEEEEDEEEVNVADA